MEADSNSTKKARVAALTEELDAIHFANSRYWKRGRAVTGEERAEYQRRQDRLEEIRRELDDLQGGVGEML
jgi:hypothetical protein